MEILIDKKDSEGWLKIIGEIDGIEASRELYRDICNLAGCEKIEIDLSEMNYANSMFIDVLLKFRRESGLKPSQIILLNPTDHVWGVLQALGANKVFSTVRYLAEDVAK